MQRKLQEKYTTVDLITGERGNITPVIDNQVLNRTDYDLIICDAYVWGTGNIANQDNLNYNLITISNDSNVTENNLIGEHIYTSDERVDTVITQPGILQDMTISSAGEWDASSMYKIKFKDGVRVLATATYQGDSETYDAIGYTTVGGYKQIHSQLVLYTNYVEVLERLVEFALE